MSDLTEKLEKALDAALDALKDITASAEDRERIEASKALIHAVDVATTQLRKEKMATAMMPVIEAVSKNLSGQLSDEDDYCPVYALDTAQQGSLLLQLQQKLG